MARLATFLGCLLVCCTFFACGPISREPLVQPDEAQPDERLYGVWISDDADRAREYIVLHIGSGGPELGPGRKPGWMQAWWVKHRSNTESGRPVAEGAGCAFLPLKMGDANVASISTDLFVPIPVSTTDLGALADWRTSTPGYLTVLYQVTNDRLELRAMDHEFVARAIEGGNLPGKVTRRSEPFAQSEVEITGSSEELRRFVELSLNKGLFRTEPLVFRRLIQSPKR